MSGELLCPIDGRSCTFQPCIENPGSPACVEATDRLREAYNAIPDKSKENQAVVDLVRDTTNTALDLGIDPQTFVAHVFGE